MKILKIVLSVLIAVGLLICAILFYQYEHNYKKTNLIQERTKGKVAATAFTSSAESQAQRQAEVAKNYRQIVLEQLKKGNVDAAATIGPTKEVEDHILAALQGDNWFAGAGMIQGLLYGYKWSPDRFSMKIRDALVDVLEREIKKYKPPYDFKEGSEMLTLIYDVCNLYDPRALPLILQLNELKCLSLYGDTGAGIVLSEMSALKTKITSTRQEVVDLLFAKVNNITALGGFTNSPTTWDSLSPDIQQKIRDAIYDDVKDKDWSVRVWAIKALVPIADKKDVVLLKKLYEDHEKVGTVYPVHEEAQKALTQRPFLWNLLDRETQNKIRNNIYNKLKDKDWIVRWNAMKELAPIADKRDIPLLKKLSEDPVSYVSEVAKKTLEELKTKGVEP
jgi:hypothetical protein